MQVSAILIFVTVLPLSLFDPLFMEGRSILEK